MERSRKLDLLMKSVPASALCWFLREAERKPVV
jgi:hypothetical protein